MAGYKIIFTLGIGLLALITLANGAAIDLENETAKKNEHQKFFRKLTKEEQYALMSLAIANYNYTNADEIRNSTALFPTHPMTKPNTQELPRTLFSTMMNGDVPKNFMKKFIKWLRKDFNLTNASFDRYLSSTFGDELCRDDAGNDCTSIYDAGSLCCPFG